MTLRLSLAIGTAAMALAAATALDAQPTPQAQPGQQSPPPSAFEREMQARVAQDRQQQAQRDAAARRMLERDVAVGNMTPEQQAEYMRYVRDRVDQVVNREGRDLSRTSTQTGQNLADNVSTRTDTGVFDPAQADRYSDRQYAEAAAHGAVEVQQQAVGAARANLRDSRQYLDAMAQASADIAHQREQMINANPNISAAERARVRAETAQIENAAATWQRTSQQRFDEADYRLQERARQARESEATVARRIEQQVAQHGRDPTQWGPSGSSSAQAAGSRTPPPPASEPEAPPPAPSASPADRNSSAAHTPRSGDPRGTQGDLSQGPRVPRSQGGTGAETEASRRAAEQEAARQAQAQQQAERNASRTEDARQRAMDQARRDNEAADSAWNSADNRRALEAVMRQLQLDAELDAIREELERSMRPGQVGRGGSAAGGSGNGGGGADFMTLFSNLPGWTTPGDLSADGLIALAAAARQQLLDANARREAARLANERARLAAAAQARNAQDANWRAMVDASFRTFQSPGWGAFDDLDPLRRGALYDAVWEAFERNGGNLTTLELEAIYANYNPLNAIPPAQSLSSAPNSLSAAGHSLSAAGTPVRSGTDNYDDPAVQSLYEALYGLTQRRRGPLGPSDDDVQTANMGDYDLYSDPTGRWGRESGGYLAASLFGDEVDYLSRSIVNGRGGLSALLAQPFNVILSWGAGAYDLDLHMTGPTGLGETDRFHIYYSAAGSLTSFPFAALIKDCICNAGSEVILTTTLLGGGVYRVSVFNFGDQASNSNNLSNFSNATIQIVRGGVATAQGNGTTITGGRTILTTNVPIGQFGNTWLAVELDPRSGRITVPRTILQSQDSAHVR